MGTSHTRPSDPKLGRACTVGLGQLIYIHRYIKNTYINKQQPDTRQTQVLITRMFALGGIQTRDPVRRRQLHYHPGYRAGLFML